MRHDTYDPSGGRFLPKWAMKTYSQDVTTYWITTLLSTVDNGPGRLEPGDRSCPGDKSGDMTEARPQQALPFQLFFYDYSLFT